MIRRITEFLKIPESIRIPIIAGYWYKFIKYMENYSILREKIPKNPLNTEKRDIKITVSLTSFPARINYVHLAIKSLMLQSVKPDRIILWLAEEQFKSKVLPKELLELEIKGLEIKWVDGNLYGHKKYFYSLQHQQSNELVITYDDDIIYPIHSIKRLIETHKKFPKAIVCNRAQSLIYNCNDNNIINPGRWKTISSVGIKEPTYKLAPSTGGGCLYPYSAINLELLNYEKIVDSALKGDDLWIMFAAAESGTKFIKTHKYHKIFSTLNDSQDCQLSNDNIINDLYIETLNNLKENFPQAWERILYDID